MTALEREPWSATLAGDYRMREVLGGWELIYVDPAMHRDQVVAFRETAVECVAAYERICDGEQVEVGL